MARKRKRRLGHVTMQERFDVSAAINSAESSCYQFGDNTAKFNGCVKGVRFVMTELEKKGFTPIR